jgi:hypothetical protein
VGSLVVLAGIVAIGRRLDIETAERHRLKIELSPWSDRVIIN